MKLVILALTVPLLLETSVVSTLTFSVSASTATRAVILTQSNWQQFSSPTGKFTVSLPGKPTEELDTDDDGSVAKNFTVVDGETVYLITYSDLVSEVNQVNPIEIFDAVCEGYTADGDKLVNKHEVQLDGHPGRLVELNTTDGLVGKASMYLVGNRLYQLILISPDKNKGDRFFKSFHISN